MQAGGHRFDPGQLHQDSFAVSESPPFIEISDADPETGRCDSGRFLTASGRAVARKNETAWMFDNEIDWVTRLECRLTAVRRMEWQETPNTFIYKAEHMRVSRSD